MYQIVKSDGYLSSLGVSNIPVIVDDQYLILDGPNRFIYDKIARGDWKSYCTWNQRASELLHFFNWLDRNKGSEIARPDWDLVTSSVITKYWRDQQHQSLRQSKYMPVEAINSRINTVRGFYKWCSENNIFNLVELNDISSDVFVERERDDDFLAHCRGLDSFYIKTNKLKLKKVNKAMVRFIVQKDDFLKASSYFSDIAFLICAYLYYLCGLRRFEVTEFLTLDSQYNPDLLTKKKLQKSGLIDQRYLKYRFIAAFFKRVVA